MKRYGPESFVNPRRLIKAARDWAKWMEDGQACAKWNPKARKLYETVVRFNAKVEAKRTAK